MKKLFIALTMVTALLLAACGNKTAKTEAQTEGCCMEKCEKACAGKHECKHEGACEGEHMCKHEGEQACDATCKGEKACAGTCEGEKKACKSTFAGEKACNHACEHATK